MKIANWYENCKAILMFWCIVPTWTFAIFIWDTAGMKTCSGTEGMFWFNCGVDDKNSTKHSFAIPSTIHISIPIPILTKSDSYFKPWFLFSLAFPCQNIHNPYLYLWISHCAFGFLSAELALGIIFLAILSIFTCCESGWLIPSPTKKSTVDITHPHTTHNHTTKKVTPGSLAAALQQRAALWW